MNEKQNPNTIEAPEPEPTSPEAAQASARYGHFGSTYGGTVPHQVPGADENEGEQQ